MGTPMGAWCDLKQPKLKIELEDGKRVRCECGRLLSPQVINHLDGDVEIRMPPHKTKPKPVRRPKGDRKCRLSRRG